MSAIAPIRSAAGRNRTVTRSPVARASGPPLSTTWSIAVSAPSRRMSAHANGFWSGCLGSGLATHAHDSTVPPGPTSTSSPVSSPVFGSYSVGGTMTEPPDPRTPSSLPSRSPVRNAPMTGPTEREYGYSMWCSACSASLSAIPILPLAPVFPEFPEVEHISVLSANTLLAGGVDQGTGSSATSSGATVGPWAPLRTTGRTSSSSSPTRSASEGGSREDVALPWRDRLRGEGLEFTNYFTHSSPCSPSRASLFTGRYLEGHGVRDNVIMPEHFELPSSTPTLGSLLDDAGYRSSYIGKWHLSHSPTPDMEAYGFADWDGNDRHFMGWAGTGVHFDPIIATNAAHWLEKNAQGDAPGSGGAGSGRTGPWFLTVALVNPHDVMWFPVDQPGVSRRAPRRRGGHPAGARVRRLEGRRPPPRLLRALPRDGRPAAGQLRRRPAHQARGAPPVALGPAARAVGVHRPGRRQAWLRHLDYYVHLHQLADRSLGTVLSALEAAGAWDDTVVIFTSDHGDMCGSHGLRSKGPFVYDEIMRVPLYIKVPGVTTAGSVTSALGSHVDLAATICSLAGVDPAKAGADRPGNRSFSGAGRSECKGA